MPFQLKNLEISSARLKKEALQANLDPLTQISNRRFGTELLTASFAEFRATNISPAIVMFDIDHFKSINDTYGHDVGDKAPKLRLQGEPRLPAE